MPRHLRRPVPLARLRDPGKALKRYRCPELAYQRVARPNSFLGSGPRQREMSQPASSGRSDR